MPADPAHLEKLAKYLRYLIIACTTEAGSGHPTSSLSAVELMAALMFGGHFRYDAQEPQHPNNDRLIFSKGHASPLFYALWVTAGRLSEAELLSTYRKLGSPLEGHPTDAFPYAEAATGSLGQGLSIGVGMALNAKYLDRLPYRTYVLIGDSEMAEGSAWEAAASAAYYRLDNLIAILDVNRLGQRGETMYGHDLSAYEKRLGAFGWETFVIDGHSFPAIQAAYREVAQVQGRPTMIIARTIKGKGVSFLEDVNGWHGKPLNRGELERALGELGPVDREARGELVAPQDLRPPEAALFPVSSIAYDPQEKVATRKAYGNALARLFPQFPQLVSLDGEVSNSTMAEIFKQAHPGRFFEMFVAEQNMVGVGLGLSRRGKLPFVSSFAAFLSRAFDQIRMSQYSGANLKFVGSHAGVSIGADGPSQMGLEDLAMFRTIRNGVVFYPADAVATEKLVEEAARYPGIVYLRTTREATPILYEAVETFSIGGSKVLRESAADRVSVVAAGITLFEALQAYEKLKQDGVALRVIDLYCVKPVDAATLARAATETRAILTVEDHYPEGGLGEAVMSALATVATPVYSLAVRRKPQSGTPRELLELEEISASAIVRRVKEILTGG